jgi:hypothetical protein
VEPDPSMSPQPPRKSSAATAISILMCSVGVTLFVVWLIAKLRRETVFDRLEQSALLSASAIWNALGGAIAHLSKAERDVTTKNYLVWSVIVSILQIAIVFVGAFVLNPPPPRPCDQSQNVNRLKEIASSLEKRLNDASRDIQQAYDRVDAPPPRNRPNILNLIDHEDSLRLQIVALENVIDSVSTSDSGCWTRHLSRP